MYICIEPRGPSPQVLPPQLEHCGFLWTGPCWAFSPKELSHAQASCALAAASVRSLFEDSEGVSLSRLSEFTVIHLLMSIQTRGTFRFGSALLQPLGVGEGRLHHPPHSRPFQGWRLSLRASESHSRTLCGPRLCCKAHCASRKSHRLSVGS